MHDRFRFLTPWSLVLPSGGGAVLAAVGAGGKTEWLLRLLRVYREQGRSVLWTQTVDHAPPPALRACVWPEQPDAAREALGSDGVVFVAGPRGEDGRHAGLPPDAVEQVRAALSPDVVLVEAHDATGTPLRDDSRMPIWPHSPQLCFAVANLAATGRVFGSRVVAGAADPPRAPGEEPRRVEQSDYERMLLAPGGLLQELPATGLAVPVLTGFGSFRDIDGMFALVQRLWAHPRVKVVCLAELLGDMRRDAADLQWVDGASMPTSLLEGERVYAVYPAELDQEGDAGGDGGALAAGDT